MESETDLRSSI